MVHTAHEVLNNNFKVFMTKKIKSLKGALGVEPRTYRSAVDCSTTELYPRVMKKGEILQKSLLFVASPLLHVQFMFKSHLLIPNTVFCASYNN